jgi:hypothetical protein
MGEKAGREVMGERADAHARAVVRAVHHLTCITASSDKFLCCCCICPCVRRLQAQQWMQRWPANAMG